MEEIPCFLSYEHSSFLLGNCGYSPTPDPVVTSIQIFVLSMVGVMFGGLVYYGLKYKKEKKAQRNLRSGSN